uniref:Hypothetical conserved protein n=1 Tax=uncultured prokaryote TaxID=198431 RepID=H5SM12_9ZZZZ|nr:hypothetical conserved protein [uncultured prokaryote]
MWAFLILLFVLSACAKGNASPNQATVSALPTIPAEYAGRSNPLGSEAASAGSRLFSTYCAACHGERGSGDGPAASSLDPKPRNLAEFVPQVRDDYLFWRIAEGVPGTAMVGWKGSLSEEQIWQVIAFLRSLK